MPRRVAFFVEGNTEAIFVSRLLTEYLPVQTGLQIDHRRVIGEGMYSYRLSGTPPDMADFHVLLVDCANDERVLSYAVDQLPYLRNAGYESLTLLRDLFPSTLAALPKIRQVAADELADAQISAGLYIAVMEIEAWFLADASHLAQIDPLLTVEYVLIQTGIDLNVASVEGIAHPSASLNTIMQLCGRGYGKHEAEVHRSVSRIDFASLCTECADALPGLAAFLARINAVFS